MTRPLDLFGADLLRFPRSAANDNADRSLHLNWGFIAAMGLNVALWSIVWRLVRL
jgi:hypothetical protein